MLYEVIDAARFFALIATVERWSASGCLGDTPRRFFIARVSLPPNKARSPIDWMAANPCESTPRSNASPARRLSVSVRVCRADSL